MKLFMITFGIFILVILGMAIGYIFRGQTIKGSCGGITALGMKKMCDCEEPCDNLKQKAQNGDEQAQAELKANFEPKFYEVK